MRIVDVFNGDADGICALLQLRLANPIDSHLVTGIKRDIELLARVDACAGDRVTVLDISMRKNLPALNRLLASEVEVFYVDHHISGDIPAHPNLTAIIDTNPNICTSLLVDRELDGKYRDWAVAAAFGDNLVQSATDAARVLGIGADQLRMLENLGVCINYNGYGSSLDDLHFTPDTLYRELIQYRSPFDYIADAESSYKQLLAGYHEDMERASAISSEFANDAIAVYILPDAAWSRRVSGVYGNQLANAYPDRAHAVISYNNQGGYLVSVRAPLNNKFGAGQLCQRFSSGGGREAAAGINHLPKSDLSRFIHLFSRTYQSQDT